MLDTRCWTLDALIFNTIKNVIYNFIQKPESSIKYLLLKLEEQCHAKS